MTSMLISGPLVGTGLCKMSIKAIQAVCWLHQKQFDLTRHCLYLLDSILLGLAAPVVHQLLYLDSFLEKTQDHLHRCSNIAAGDYLCRCL